LSFICHNNNKKTTTITVWDTRFMKQFKPNLIKAALISGGMAFGSAPALAQEANTDAVDEESLEVIQVSGIRGSLQRAQAIKMDNTSIVEALSAEDIGKLPDTSIAESIARLPGVTGERRNGRTSGISVRGFNENYVGTSLNGRELLGMGDNRGVEFDLYPTEIISNILVYKTPEAGMTTQNIGGSIDLQTVKPLTAESTFTVNGTFEKNAEDSPNPDFDNDGHRISVNFVDQFADDTIGLALTVASMESPRQEQYFRGWGYADVGFDSELRDLDSVEVPAGTVVLGGHDSFQRSAMLERDSIASRFSQFPLCFFKPDHRPHSHRLHLASNPHLAQVGEQFVQYLLPFNRQVMTNLDVLEGPIFIHKFPLQLYYRPLKNLSQPP